MRARSFSWIHKTATVSSLTNSILYTQCSKCDPALSSGTDTHGSIRSVTSVEHEKRSMALTGTLSASVMNNFMVCDIDAIQRISERQQEQATTMGSLATESFNTEQVLSLHSHTSNTTSMHAVASTYDIFSARQSFSNNRLIR